MLFICLFLCICGGGGGGLYYYQTKGKANKEAKKKQKAIDAIPDYDVGNAAIANDITAQFNVQAHRQTLYNDAMGNGGSYGGGGGGAMYHGNGGNMMGMGVGGGGGGMGMVGNTMGGMNNGVSKK